jgi:hypothetical protein
MNNKEENLQALKDKMLANSFNGLIGLLNSEQKKEGLKALFESANYTAKKELVLEVQKFLYSIGVSRTKILLASA